jgi:tetratricopeptide (TPR) repeat protein
MSRPASLAAVAAILAVGLASPAVARAAADATNGPTEAPHTDAEAQLLFRQGNDAFLAKHYDEARADYWALVDAGFGTADVYFNLGNAALKAGKLGEAVLAYERALRRDPGDDDARANLALARKQNVDKVVGGGSGPAFFTRVARVVPPGPVTVAFLIAWCLLFAALLTLRLLRRRRVLISLVAALGLLGSVVAGSLLADVAWYRDHVVQAVVMDPVIQVRKGPAPRFDTAFELHQGFEVRLLDQDGPYVQVRLVNGLEGWVLRRSLRTI